MSGEPEHEYLADGRHRGHHHRPGAAPLALRHRAQLDLRLKGKPTDVRDVARALGVRYVLEGSVRQCRNGVFASPAS